MAATDDVKLHYCENLEALPSFVSKQDLVNDLHFKMEPFNDSLKDVEAGVDYALRIDTSKYGGFVTLATRGEELLGAVVMLKTGMVGYIPPWLLLMVYVDPTLRGQGIGGKLIAFTREHCDGDIKLHVEYDNPAKRLYERIGFKTKYAEMRLANP